MKATRILAAALIAAALTGCTGGGKAPSVGLTGAGATFPYPIYSKWFEMYHESTGVQINYQSIGSGGGIQQLKAGTVDFGASDAPLNDEKLAEMPHPVLHIPTVAGAVVLAYNLPELTQPLQLTPQALAGIFMGTVKTWNDPAIQAANPGVVLPATAVLAVHRSDGSGTSNIFTTYLSAVSPDWKTKVGANTSVAWPAGVGAKGNEGVTGQVKQTPGSIGYVELAYAKQNSLATAKLQNSSGAFIEPSLASTTAAIRASAQALAADVRAPTVDAAGPDAYPIAALTFILVYEDQKDAAKGKEIANFLHWAIHQGQDEVEALQYARLPAEIVTVDEASIAKLTSGGKPLAAR
ncbi:MAG TPA: phosphate ABC transporter substrate-binding protein PstS [Candidatus Eisenbacteria bacterium]|jgi:phosphate transport system substrate-binding protein|nr:phosphate ABC transporter substrate-binding protein PstS [Candidatus Eisenbacteria bacterium]